MSARTKIGVEEAWDAVSYLPWSWTGPTEAPLSMCLVRGLGYSSPITLGTMDTGTDMPSVCPEDHAAHVITPFSSWVEWDCWKSPIDCGLANRWAQLGQLIMIMILHLYRSFHPDGSIELNPRIYN